MLAGLLLVGNMAVMPAEAGSSNLIVDNKSFKQELDIALWNATDDRVTAENGKLVFSAESKKSTALITKTIATNTGYHDELVSFEATMNLSGVAAGETFVAALGLGSIEAVMGEPGNVEIQFANDGGIKMSVVAYDLDGNATEIVAPRAAGTKASIKAVISSEGVFTLTLGGSRVCMEKLPVSGEGRVGFVQSGNCAVTVDDLKIVAHRYDRPENCDIYEDFENESINVNTLTAKSLIPSYQYVPYGMGIQDFDGSRGLIFQNLACGYMGSLHKYSNFEITFDVVYLQRESELDDEGNIVVPQSDCIVVSFGDEAEDYNDWGYTTSPDAIVFDAASNVYSMHLEPQPRANAAEKGYAFASPECKTDFTIRVSMIDGVATTSMKWVGEDTFTEILKYKVSDETPLGFVHIWAAGSNNNFAIDNVRLINKDIDPNTISLDFKSALYNTPEDFEYEKIGFVYRDTAEEDKGFEFTPYMLIPVIAVVCVVAFGIVCLISKKKTGKGEEVNVQEQDF